MEKPPWVLAVGVSGGSPLHQQLQELGGCIWGVSDPRMGCTHGGLSYGELGGSGGALWAVGLCSPSVPFPRRAGAVSQPLPPAQPCGHAPHRSRHGCLALVRPLRPPPHIMSLNKVIGPLIAGGRGGTSQLPRPERP